MAFGIDRTYIIELLIYIALTIPLLAKG